MKHSWHWENCVNINKKQPEPHEKLQTIYEKIGLDDLADEEAEIANKLRKALYKASKNKKK